MVGLLTIGRWRVAESGLEDSGLDSGGLNSWRIEHKCITEDSIGREKGMWWPWTYSVLNRAFPCYACHEKPDDAIQAVFWMLVGDDQ